MASFKQTTRSTWRAIKDIFEDDVRPPKTPAELQLASFDATASLRGNESLYIKVVAARGLLAMDTNNLSDPYATVSLGGQAHMTRVCRKTLAPVFDECVVFDADTIRKAVALGEAYVTVTMLDWDQFSADDFMGIGVVLLSEVFSGCVEVPVLLKVPLIGYKGSGKKRTRVECGTVQLCAWTHAQEVPAVDFSWQLGLRGAPRMLHGGTTNASIVEEPYLMVLCLNFLDVLIDENDDRPLPSPRSQLTSTVSRQTSRQRSGQYREELRRKQVADAMGLGDDEEVYEGLSEDPNGAHHVGSFAYFRVSLCKRTKTSHLVRQQGGRIPISDMVPFLLPAPVPDGQIQLVLYRTHATKAAGQATHVCLVDIHALLPMDELRRPDVDLTCVSKKVSLSLTPLKKNQQHKQVTLKMSATFADLDFRRRFSNVPIVGPRTGPGWADPMVAVSVLDQDLTTRLSDDDLLELEARTDEEFQEYFIHKIAYEQQKKRVEGFVRGAVERQLEKVEKVIGKDVVHGRQVLSEAEGVSILSSTVPDNPIDDQEALISSDTQLGRLTVMLEALRVSKEVGNLQHAAVIFNVEQTWFRTGDFRNISTAPTESLDLAVTVPIVSPAAMFSACLVSKARKKDSKEVSRGGFVDQGVLRFRLSTLECGKNATITLPFLSSREKGGKIIGEARFTVRVDFPTLKARMRGFTRPEYPQECYVHMINSPPTMSSLQQERRELLQDWMLSMNPPFPSEAVKLISRVDCGTFSLSRLRANLRRIRVAIKGLRRLKKHFDLLASWRHPNLSRLGLVGAALTAYHPSKAISMLAIVLAYNMWKDMPLSYIPDAMEEDGVGLDILDRTEKEELREGVQLQIVGSGVVSKLKHRWSSVTGILFMVQSKMDTIASILERFVSLLEWKAPLVSASLMLTLVGVSLLVWAVGLRAISAGLLMFTLRPPRMRKPWTPGPISMFLKLPVRGDVWS